MRSARFEDSPMYISFEYTYFKSVRTPRFRCCVYAAKAVPVPQLLNVAVGWRRGAFGASYGDVYLVRYLARRQRVRSVTGESPAEPQFSRKKKNSHGQKRVPCFRSTSVRRDKFFLINNHKNSAKDKGEKFMSRTYMPFVSINETMFLITVFTQRSVLQFFHF